MIWMEKAPAKINLTLDVLYKRDDGYHEVEMVMTTVDLADRVVLREMYENNIVIQSQNFNIPNDHRNLAYQAALILKRKYNIKTGVIIDIEKNIPIAAGLAGGSSDAAATLRGLNQLWQLGLSLDELAVLGAEIGSDVSFCVYGGTALATGRGEIIQHIPAPPNCWVILVKPKMGVSTADVYKALDLQNITHPNTRKMIESIENQDFQGVCDHLGNVLETVTLNKYPEVFHIKEQLKKFGADAVLMSGSGPTVYALCEQETKMQRVYNGLMGFSDQIFTVRLLGR